MATMMRAATLRGTAAIIYMHNVEGRHRNLLASSYLITQHVSSYVATTKWTGLSTV